MFFLSKFIYSTSQQINFFFFTSTLSFIHPLSFFNLYALLSVLLLQWMQHHYPHHPHYLSLLIPKPSLSFTLFLFLFSLSLQLSSSLFHNLNFLHSEKGDESSTSTISHLLNFQNRHFFFFPCLVALVPLVGMSLFFCG